MGTCSLDSTHGLSICYLSDYENGLEKAIGMFRNRHLSRMESWHGVQELIRYRNITTRFLLKLSQRVEQAAFHGWLDIVDERKRNRVKAGF